MPFGHINFFFILDFYFPGLRLSSDISTVNFVVSSETERGFVFVSLRHEETSLLWSVIFQRLRKIFSRPVDPAAVECLWSISV